MIDYQNQQIVIIGLGITGMSCINFFLRRNIIPKVMDTRVAPPELKQLPENIPYYFGGLNEQWLLNADLIVVSPGISRNHPSLIKASHNAEIVGDIELFAREVTKPVIAITGSNGKSTVAYMTHKIITNYGWNSGLGGNFGCPALSLLDTDVQIYILELSSFQLETTYTLSPISATILNISEDHMDRYPYGLHQYRSAKLKIYQRANKCIINAQDSLTFPAYGRDTRCISFGEKEADYSLNQHHGSMWLYTYGRPLINCSEIFIQGKHNYMNILASLALTNTVGISHENSLEVLCKFPGLPHRFELVHNRNNILWINDSKATNIGSTQAALNGLEIAGTLHLLLGGDGKSANFSLLTPNLQNNKIRIYCFGKDRDILSKLNPDYTIITDTLEQAMYIIGKNVQSGDMVLLSPACSSLDQFINFEERGNIFVRLAQEIG